MALNDELLANNAAYAAHFDAGALRLRPAREIAILTCMDSRFTAQGVLGLRLGDAHVIRNAGGRVTEDALRSLVLSAALLGTRTAVVIHHSNCGLYGTSNDALRERVAEVAGAPVDIDFLPFTDLEASVREDVAALREYPHFPPGYEVLGYTYDVVTGRLTPVSA